MSARHKWTDHQLVEAVEKSLSISAVLRSLGLIPAGGNYRSVHKHIARLNLDISHFTGQGHLKGKTHNWTKKIPLEEILVENSSFGTWHLKKRLLKEGYLKNQCYTCGINAWLGQSLNLHLDHVNGINDDARLENLRLLCPNCHSQTDTYCGRNKSPGTI